MSISRIADKLLHSFTYLLLSIQACIYEVLKFSVKFSSREKLKSCSTSVTVPMNCLCI